jgi:hypothetical protein
MPEQLKVKPSVDCHHPASVISASTIPAARCGPAVEGLIPRRPDDKIGVAAAYARVGDNARGFDSDIGSFGNFFYSVRRMETMVDGAHSHLSCFSLPCQRNAFLTLSDPITAVDVIKHGLNYVVLRQNNLRSLPGSAVSSVK